MKEIKGWDSNIIDFYTKHAKVVGFQRYNRPTDEESKALRFRKTKNKMLQQLKILNRHVKPQDERAGGGKEKS